MDGRPAPPESVGQAEDRIAIELALAESVQTEWLQPQQQPSPQPAQFSGQPDEWIQDKCGKWWQRDVNDSWWNCEKAGVWHCATAAELAGILAATQGDAAPVAAQLQPQPQPQYGQTRGGEASSEVDREADKRWSLVGGGVKKSEIWEDETDDSSSEASPDQQDFGILD